MAIWTYVSVCPSAGRTLTALWIYAYACVSAGDRVDLRLCVFERRRRYGVTFLNIAAPAVIWTCLYAYASVAGGGAKADVSVARVSFTLRSPQRLVQVLAPYAGRLPRARFCKNDCKTTGQPNV